MKMKTMKHNLNSERYNGAMMRTVEQTTQEVLDLAAKHFQVAQGPLTADDDFLKNLGINSLQALELLSRLENHFGVELPDHEVQGVSDFRTLVPHTVPSVMDDGSFQILIYFLEV
jgi:acyl carrier protein